MGSRMLPQYIGDSSSCGSAFGRLPSRPVFSSHNSSCDLWGFRPTAAAASELPIPCLRTASQSSRGNSLVLIRRKAGRVLRFGRGLRISGCMVDLSDRQMPSSADAEPGIHQRGKRADYGERTDKSGNQVQGRIESPLLDDRTLTKPGRVHPVLGTACTAFVIHKLGDGIEQSPGSAFGRLQFGTFALAVVEALHFLQSAFIGQ